MIELENLRESGLELIASGAEALHRAKQYTVGFGCNCSCDRCQRGQCACPSCRSCMCGPCGCGSAARPDFLFDYTRLSLGYLNQLLRLGSSYTAFPSRCMEKLYACAMPWGCGSNAAQGGTQSPRGKTLTQEVTQGGTATFEFRVKNCGSATKQARIYLHEFRDGSGAIANGMKWHLECRGKTEKPPLATEVDPGVPLTIRVPVVGLKALEPERRFVANVDVFMDGQSDSVALELRTK